MYDTYDNDFDKAFDEAVDRLDRQQNWRPIYAEKLKAHYSWWKGGTGTMTYDEAKETFDTIIDLQPTAEPNHGMTKGEYATLVGLHTYSPAYDKDAPLDEDFVKTVEGIRRIVLEPKHGRWIIEERGGKVLDLVRYHCSVCGEWQTWSEYHYCPNCGCMMDEAEPTRYDTTFGDGSPVTLTDV